MAVSFQTGLNYIRKLRHTAEVVYGAALSMAQGAPEIVEGEVLGSLRGQLIGRPETRYQAGISNCGLMKLEDGYLGIVKNNTFNFCRQRGISAEYGPGDWPVRSELLQIKLNELFEVQRVDRLALRSGDQLLEDPDDLREDARLISTGSSVWCSVNLVPKARMSKALPVFGRLDQSGAILSAVDLAMPRVRKPEKNWIPFASDGELFLQYSVNPHIVFRVDQRSGAVQERYSTFFVSPFFGFRGPFYRGSAPLVPFDGHYLGVAHSVVYLNGEKDYRTHFYLTGATPPFAVRWLGDPVKLVRNDRIQYVSAAVVEPERQRVVLSFGVDDCDNLFVGVNPEDIRKTLRRIA